MRTCLICGVAQGRGGVAVSGRAGVRDAEREREGGVVWERDAERERDGVRDAERERRGLYRARLYSGCVLCPCLCCRGVSGS